MRRELCATVALLVVWLAACLAIADVGDLEAVDETGAGGHACAVVSDCPDLDVDCQEWTCPDGRCELGNVSRGTQCDDDGGRVCDGDGNCVECASDNHCLQYDYCDQESFTCEPKKANGAPCTRDAECLSNDCRMGWCQGSQPWP